jgi:WD40 repeat protein
LESIAYTIPPGAAGNSVNVSITTGAGMATATNALSYLPATQQFPMQGSALAQGIYDSYTDLYYFTDATQLQVFSRSQGKWLAPVPIAPPAGASERLWGLALSPNGTMMAVADVGSGVIYLLNPASPSTVKTFPTSSIYGQTLPSGVAVSDSGVVYYTTAGQGSGYLDNFFKLDTDTGKITDYGIEGPETPGEALLRTEISSDNSTVFFNDQGYVFSINTATDKLLPAANTEGCCYGNYELALSSNQAQFTASDYIYDFDLNGESYYALNDRELLNILYVYGAKFSPDGRLLFQSSANGIDVFGNGTGSLQNRISLPESLSPNYDALVGDGSDNILVAITGTGDGIAQIDLTSIVEPQPLPGVRRTGTSGLASAYGGRGSRTRKVTRPPVQRSLEIKHLTRALAAVK